MSEISHLISIQLFDSLDSIQPSIVASNSSSESGFPVNSFLSASSSVSSWIKESEDFIYQSIDNPENLHMSDPFYTTYPLKIVPLATLAQARKSERRVIKYLMEEITAAIKSSLDCYSSVYVYEEFENLWAVPREYLKWSEVSHDLGEVNANGPLHVEQFTGTGSKYGKEHHIRGLIFQPWDSRRVKIVDALSLIGDHNLFRSIISEKHVTFRDFIAVCYVTESPSYTFENFLLFEIQRFGVMKSLTIFHLPSTFFRVKLFTWKRTL